MKKIGLIVNPVAGMGGKVGLKGTDGTQIAEKALLLGASPEAPSKAAVALRELEEMSSDMELITCPGQMGENSTRCSNFKPVLLGGFNEPTTAADTEKAAREIAEQNADLLLFAGGDGTARNIYNALGADSALPVIGIPAGVKIHSAVYATNPRSAGELAKQFLQLEGHPVRQAEVMDIDEEAFRDGRLSARLYGYLKVPRAELLMQSLKIGGAGSEESALEGIAAHVVENMQRDTAYLIGPGSTTVPVLQKLGLKGTLLGVDVVMNGKLLAVDANEAKLLEIVRKHPAKIIVTVIGGQGYLFGRGNQQISAAVIKKTGRDNIIVVAGREKILAFSQGRLLADTGDPEVNQMLKGYYKIVTGYREELIFPLSV